MPACAATAVAVLFAGELPPAAVYPFVVPSVAWVRADPDGVGTGWLAADRLLVTCRHVVGGQKRVEVFFPRVERGRLRTGRAEYLGDREALRRNGTLVTGRVTRTADRVDLAVVELDSVPAGRRRLRLAPTTPSPGDRVWSVGNRHDLESLWTVSTGPVRQAGRLTDGYFWQGSRLAADARSLLLQLPIAEGDSGGPVLDRRGRVVAVVAAHRTRTPLGTVGVAADEVRELLGEPPAVEENGDRPSLFAALAPATVWVRPTATDARTAGVVIDRERRLVLTSASGAGEVARVGVTFPLPARDGRWPGEREAYADPVSLHLAGAWRAGTVIARDERRDLALVRLDSLPAWARAVPLARHDPAVGEPVHTIGHPTGAEFTWVYAAGTVRQRGRVRLGRSGEQAESLVLQFPAQGNASGGPVVNARGELLGVLAAKAGTEQQVAYASARDEVRAFLDDPAARAAAARLAPLDRAAIDSRAEAYLRAREPKKAAGELARLLDVDPADPDARRRFAVAWAQALDDERAARAFADVLRLDPKDYRRVAADVGRHADELHKKSPAGAESWLRTAVPALAAALPPGAERDRLTAARGSSYPVMRDALKPDAKSP